ncbi:MAG: glycerol-3-phosphate 1-O-acyltransferase PlsY [Pseudomonadota bacterium]|jgi:glycerol-3-phosphate acyltransferase PlsY
MTLLPALFAVLLAYLLGSVPFAVVVSRCYGLADPRSYGSGNPGATNVLRSGNKAAAVLTLLGDAAKGAVAVIAVRYAFGEGPVLWFATLAVFFGHLFPVFLRFRGGKGVATAAGVLLALSLPLGLAVLLTWLFVAFASRYSSLAAIVAAGLAPVYAVLADGVNGLSLTAGIMALALIGKHWGNIQRLMAGQESRIGDKKKKA